MILWIPYIIFFILSLVTLTWFNSGTVIAGGDHIIFLDLYTYLSKLNSSWNSYLNAGIPSFHLERHLPFSLLFMPLNFFHIPYIYAQYIWAFSSSFLSMAFMYKFLNKFWGSSIFNILGSILYFYNPLMFLIPLNFVITKFPIYLFLPVLAYVIYNLKSKNVFFSVLSFSFILSLSSSSFSNIAEIVPALIVLSFIYLIVLIMNKFSIKHLLFPVFTLVIFVGLNFWWLYSSIYSQFIYMESFVSSVAVFNPNTSFYDTLRLLGSWAFTSSHRGLPYYGFYSSFYDYSIIHFNSYVISVSLLLGLILVVFLRKSLDKWQNVKYVILFILFLLGAFFSKGSSEPWGEIYLYLYDNFPLFRIFREPYSKFSLITLFTSATLFPYVLVLLSRFLKTSLILFVIFFISILLNAYPMITGEVIPKYYNGSVKSFLSIKPAHWNDLLSYMNIINEVKTPFRVFMSPKTGSYGSSYLWPSGVYGNIPNVLMKKDILSYKDTNPKNSSDILVNLTYDLMETILKGESTLSAKTRFINLLRLLNTGFILQQNDMDWRYISGESSFYWSPNRIQSFLGSLYPWVYIDESFGLLSKEYLDNVEYLSNKNYIFRDKSDLSGAEYTKYLKDLPGLVLYKVSGDILLPRIYLADTVISEDSLNDPRLLDKRPVILEDVYFSYMNKDDLLFYKQSATQYKLIFPNSLHVKKGIIIFNESYDPDWVLCRKVSFLSCEPFTEYKHQKVNFYSNGFILDSMPDTLSIVHLSVFRLHLGVLVSVFSLLFCVVSSIFVYICQKRKTITN